MEDQRQQACVGADLQLTVGWMSPIPLVQLCDGCTLHCSNNDLRYFHFKFLAENDVDDDDDIEDFILIEFSELHSGSSSWSGRWFESVGAGILVLEVVRLVL